LFIFLEGPDGSGKSSLAKKLSSQTGMPRTSNSWPRTESEKRNMFEMYANFIYNNKGRDIIVDRCWYSEIVYGPIVRKEHNLGKGDMYELEKLVLSQGGGMVIHCTANMKALWQRFSARGDDYIDQDLQLLHKIKKEYEHLMHTVPHLIPIVRYEINENVPKL
jgi:thymidylate kinase